MDITKGSLDDISRPASGERSHTGSRDSFSEIRRTSRDGHRSLEVLSPDVQHPTDQESARDVSDCAEHSSDQDSYEEGEDPELRKAIKKMKKLDQLLALKVSAEKDVKQKRRELHLRLWQELQAVRMSPESSDEMDNTRRFFSLTPDSSQVGSGDGDFVPVFGTEVLDDLNLRCQNEEDTSDADVSEVGQQAMEDQSPDSRWHRDHQGKRRQDFVKKNIELAGVAGTSVLLTQRERDRLEELLKDREEDSIITGPSSFKEISSWCAVSGEGFSPEPAELNSLLRIDSRLHLLLPVKDFLSVRSPSPDLSSSPMRPQSLDELKRGDRGDNVLLDVRETREQERRLQEIQQQLQVLDETESSNIQLTDDQLKNLLQKCEEELIQSSLDLASGPSSAPDSHRTSPLAFSSPLSTSNPSDLLP